MFKNPKIKLMIMLLVLTVLAGCTGSAPSKEVVTTALKKVIPLNFTINEIRLLKEVPGLCEVVITASNQPMVFYMDSKGNYIVSGSVIEVATKKNLTLETLKKYQQQSKK
jgi:thiol:disulfide interchange protein DsbC